LSDKTNPMRKSREVHLTVLAAVALSMTACRTEHRDCVDPQGHLQSDSACHSSGSGVGGYHYIYGGSSGGHVGDYVLGGSTTPRGGFGGIGGGGDSAGGE
jgi:hypothetical protein